MSQISVPSTSMRDPASQRIRLDYLDGIRAIAALYIVLHHVRILLFRSSAQPRLLRVSTDWMLYGHLAVDVFIVLSGFCLMLPVAKTGELKAGTLKFYVRRAWRILPPFYAALIFSISRKAIFGFLSHPHLGLNSKEILCNAFLLQDVFPEYNNSLNSPSWSVALEWKIYFLFPFFVWLWKRHGLPSVILASAVIGYSLTELYTVLRPNVSMEHTAPWYVFLFGLGMCAATVALDAKTLNKQRNWNILGWIAFGFSVLLLNIFPITAPRTWLPFSPSLLIDPVVGLFTAALLVILSCRLQENQSSVLLKILSWRPLVAIGTFSYSLYLTHAPILTGLFLLSQRLHLRGSVQATYFILTALPLAVGFAYVFFLLFERPFLVRRKRESLAEVARDAALSPAP